MGNVHHPQNCIPSPLECLQHSLACIRMGQELHERNCHWLLYMCCHVLHEARPSELDLVLQLLSPFQLANLAGFQWPHPCRRAGEENVAFAQRKVFLHIIDGLFGGQPHFGALSPLPEIPIQGESELFIQIVWELLDWDPGADNCRAREAFSDLHSQVFIRSEGKMFNGKKHLGMAG